MSVGEDTSNSRGDLVKEEAYETGSKDKREVYTTGD